MSDTYRDEMGNEFAKATVSTSLLFANINPAALPRRCKDHNSVRGWCHAIGLGKYTDCVQAIAVFEYEKSGELAIVPAFYLTLDPVKEAV